MVITVTNNKGGVAKTTTAVNVSAALVQLGKRVLLVDADGQRSASRALGVSRDAAPTTTDVLLAGADVRDAIVQTSAGVDMVPASFELAHADVTLADVAGRERILRTALGVVRRQYDFVLIDTPPSLGLVVVNAIVAADAVLVPVVPHPLAVEGLSGLMTALERIGKGIGHAVELLGIVLTMCDYRQGVTRQLVDIVRGHFGGKVFRTEVRQSVRLVEAPYVGQAITSYAGNSSGAESYAALAGEIIQRVKK